jgi:hypothetical protein
MDENEKPVLKYLLLGGVFVIISALIGGVVYYFRDSFGLPTLALGGVLVLLGALLVFTTLMNVVGLSDKTQALGLPEGSVRAIIALALVGLFAILASAFLNPDQHRSKAGLQIADVAAFKANNPDAHEIVQITDPVTEGSPQTYTVTYVVRGSVDDFSKQMMTLIGTLMTAVISFYFGATPKTSTEVSRAAPELTGLDDPSRPAKEGPLSLTMTGNNLNGVKSVRLSQGSTEIESTSVLSNLNRLTCTFPPHPELQKASGPWDVTVVDDLGRSAVKKTWLTLT